MRHNSAGPWGRRSVSARQAQVSATGYLPQAKGPQQVSGRCTPCGGDLTLTEMREHNYICASCRRKEQP